MFEQLINETATRFNVPTAGVSSLLRGLLPMMADETTGGAQGFLDLFKRAGIGDIATSWFGGNQPAAITPTQIESALGAHTLERLAGSSGLGRTVVASILTFLLPKVINLLTPNGSLPSTGALKSAVSSLLGRTAAPAAEVYDNHRRAVVERPRKRNLLPWLAAAAAALLAAFFLMRSPAGTIDPQLTINNRGGQVTYTGLVRDESTRTAIEDGLRSAFGAGNVSGDIRVDGNVRRAAWLPRLSDLFTSLRTSGATLAVNGNDVRVGGWLSAADREALTARLKPVFGTEAAIGALGDAAADAVRAANEQVLSALGAIGTSGVSPDTVVRTMNLAIINFPTGSSEIPAESNEVIRRSAEAISKTENATIEISGHTDNVGSSSANLALSQARADSVKTALVNAGAPATRLVTRGYGDSRPRASNDSEYGRFQNRRIEYSVVQ